MNVSDHVDIDQIDSLINAAGVASAEDILEAFWRSTETLLRDATQHLAISNFEEVAKTAHALKGSAANVGAKRLAATARQVEQACHEQVVQAVHDSLTAAQKDLHLAKEHFAAHLAAAG